MQQQNAQVDAIIARIATRSHGVVTRAELRRAGVSAEQIRQRLKRGALIREYRGVYRVGHRAPSIEARYMAAVKACGTGAVLSGRAAAYLYGLISGTPPPPHVTVPGSRRVPGVATTRSERIEATTYRGIPITTVPRTLVDLAATLSVYHLGRACHEAGVKYRTTPRQVEAVLGPNAKGAGKLREVLRGEVRVALSPLESRFLELLKAAGLPLPRTNKPAGTKRVDCRWTEHRLTVELDSYRYHHSRHAWEQDRRREREAHAREDDFRRYTWSDVFEDPRLMLRELRALLA